MVKLPHPLDLSPFEVCPSFPEPDRSCKEGNKSAFHIMRQSSGETEVGDNCSRKDCVTNDGNESLNKRDSIASSNEDHVVGDVEENRDVDILSVSTTDHVAVNERKRYYDILQIAKVQAAKPDDEEVSLKLAFQNIRVQDSLSECHKENLLELILQYKNHFTKKPGKCNCFEYRFLLQDGVPKSPTVDPYHFHYAG
jgi:hypothetical protein